MFRNWASRKFEYEDAGKEDESRLGWWSFARPDTSGTAQDRNDTRKTGSVLYPSWRREQYGPSNVYGPQKPLVAFQDFSEWAQVWRGDSIDRGTERAGRQHNISAHAYKSNPRKMEALAKRNSWQQQLDLGNMAGPVTMDEWSSLVLELGDLATSAPGSEQWFGLRAAGNCWLTNRYPSSLAAELSVHICGYYFLKVASILCSVFPIPQVHSNTVEIDPVKQGWGSVMFPGNFVDVIRGASRMDPIVLCWAWRSLCCTLWVRWISPSSWVQLFYSSIRFYHAREIRMEIHESSVTRWRVCVLVKTCACCSEMEFEVFELTRIFAYIL